MYLFIYLFIYLFLFFFFFFIVFSFCCNKFYGGVIVAPCAKCLCNFEFCLLVYRYCLYVPFHVTVLLFIVVNQFQEKNCKI